MRSKKPKNTLINNDQRYDLATWNWDVANTVCFFSFVKFYDDVNQKVVEIIDFRKMSLEGIVDAFYDM